MFEKSLENQLRNIFQFQKITFDRPGESQEEEALFVVVDSVLVRIKDARQIARVTGKLHVFAPSEKLPFGALSKRLAAAAPIYTKGLFFFDFEENRGVYRNIVERSLGFIYLFDSQYEPEIGTLTQVNLTFTET